MGDLKLVKDFVVGDGFFGRYEKLVKDVVLPYQERALNDQIEGAAYSLAQNPWRVWGNDPDDKEYAQYQAPVRKQDKAVGHAVRAVYLYTGMADAAMETGDTELADVCS